MSVVRLAHVARIARTWEPPARKLLHPRSFLPYLCARDLRPHQREPASTPTVPRPLAYVISVTMAQVKKFSIGAIALVDKGTTQIEKGLHVLPIG